MGKAIVVLVALAGLALVGHGDRIAHLVRGDAAARLLGYEVHVSVMLERTHRSAAPKGTSCEVTLDPTDTVVTALPAPAPHTLWVRRVLP